MTVVVTGASGHIGTNLVRELLARGRRVRVMMHDNDRPFRGLDVARVRGDVLDSASLRRAFKDAEVLYHLAGVISIDGSKGGRVEAVNVRGAALVARMAHECGVRRMIHFSSIHAFRQQPLDQPLDETRERVGPEAAPYDRSKADGERRVRELLDEGLEVVVVHPTGVIGPDDRAPSRMGRTFLQYVRRSLPAVVPGGFDFVDVRDVVASALAAETRGRVGESYILGGHWNSVAHLMELYHQVTGLPGPRLFVPMRLAELGAPLVTLWGRITGQEPLYTGESLAALQANRNVRHDKAARDLGHAPRPTLESVEAIYKSFLDDGQLTLET